MLAIVSKYLPVSSQIEVSPPLHVSSQIPKNSFIKQQESPCFVKNSPKFMRSSEETRNSLRNLTKKIKLHEKNAKTVKKQNILKKAIKKQAKIAKIGVIHDILEVSASTLSSNTPKLMIHQEDLQEETPKFVDFSLNSSQNVINSHFIDGTLLKYKTDEVKFRCFLQEIKDFL